MDIPTKWEQAAALRQCAGAEEEVQGADAQTELGLAFRTVGGRRSPRTSSDHQEPSGIVSASRDSTLAGSRALEDASGPWALGILRSGGPRARWVGCRRASCAADRAGRCRGASGARTGGRCRGHDHGARRSAAGLYPTCTDCRTGSAAAAQTDPLHSRVQRHHDGRTHPQAACSSRLALAGHRTASWTGCLASEAGL